ncbi:HupE/UreJ family protein [Reinekea thalattae]|uniref:HupE/UreJ family protein n=1 Tax=Reinekea thalattae TaxID=2593301 RepID=A0A5C8ZAH4_9GAMM|nr:HupE/UreJ family protein [Reinekea thalattae]TXR53886.1 HupE/UreJ family protein [Reinekea thalattae]
MKKLSILSLSILPLLFPSLALAHDVAGGNGFMAGFSHPVLGFDHLLAMLSVGVLSAQLGGQAMWKVPTAFVVVMLFGGVLGMAGMQLFSVEQAIAFSVFALGVAIAAAKQAPSIVAMLFVGFFALFHGNAHGLEMPHLSSPELYATGFIIGTAAIHVAGVGIGLVARKFSDGSQLLRYVGAGIAGIGFHLFVM